MNSIPRTQQFQPINTGTKEENLTVGVVGLGYVGLSVAVAAGNAGHRVFGFDKKTSVISNLKSGNSHIEDISSAAISSYLASGSQFCDRIEELSDCDLIVIAVPTPLGADREPDLSLLRDASRAVASIAGPGTLIVNESTSYPGTLRNVIAPIVGAEKLYAAAPERIDPGNQNWLISNTPRLIGGMTPKATEKAVAFYNSFCGAVKVVSSPEVAEAAKLFENTFRQVNIALVNELAQICEGFSISTHEVLDAAATKPFGFMKFLPSLGVGGHCIPVDPSYLSFAARELGVAARFIELANEINLQMPEYVVTRIEKELGSLSGVRVEVAGISYKAGIADVRESPALELIALLRDKGAVVSWHDPLVKVWAGEESQPLSNPKVGVIVSPHAEIDFSPWRSNGVRVFDVSTTGGLEWQKLL